MEMLGYFKRHDDFELSEIVPKTPWLDCYANVLSSRQAWIWASNWQDIMPRLVDSFTANLQANLKEAIRFEKIERELKILEAQVLELKQRQSTLVLIDTLAPESFELIQPFHIVIESYDDEYRASFIDANLSALGENWNEAILNLKDIICATFDILIRTGKDRLGPGPARQLKVLKKFIRNR